MGEAFITRRGGNVTVYDVEQATISLFEPTVSGSTSKSETVVISGLNLPNNILSFCINIYTGVTINASGGSSWFFTTFILYDDGTVKCWRRDSDMSDAASGTFSSASYEVLNGNLYIKHTEDTFTRQFVKNSSKFGLRGGNIVCG